jgi:hypothetical protein
VAQNEIQDDTRGRARSTGRDGKKTDVPEATHQNREATHQLFR